MTSDNSQIQALIQQIDDVLENTSPRLPWVMSSDAVQQRQVLEQTRNYLRSLQQEAAETGSSEDAKPDAGELAVSVPAADNSETMAQQVLQAVVQEMGYLRSNLLQPMRSDVEALRLQRDALTQEIRQLEKQRQQYGWPSQNPQYLNEFLQAAMAQMQENLTGQMAQMLAAIGSQAPGNPQLLEGASTTLGPVERLEQLQLIQAQSDQLMRRLDTTLRLVFESLQSNVQSYGDSLEEGLNRMHEMGQQGEAVFGAFAARLAQMLGRETSFLQSSMSNNEWSSDRPSLPSPEKLAASDSPETGDVLYPNPQINRLLEELQALDTSGMSQSTPGEPIPFDGESFSEVDTGLEMEELDLALSQIDLSAVSSVETFEISETGTLAQEQSVSLPALDNEAESEVEPAEIPDDSSSPEASSQEDSWPEAGFAQQDAATTLDANLFAGLSDPATPNAETDLPEPTTEATTAPGLFSAQTFPKDAPQSLENWLFHSPQLSNSSGSSTLFRNSENDDEADDDEDGDEYSDDPEPELSHSSDYPNYQNNIIEVDVETIALLTDLIPPANDDRWIATSHEARSTATLDESRLDEGFNEPIGESTAEFAARDVVTHDADWTLTDWQTFEAVDTEPLLGTSIWAIEAIAAMPSQPSSEKTDERTIGEELLFTDERANELANATEPSQVVDAAHPFDVQSSVADDLLESTIDDLFAAIDSEPIDQTSEYLSSSDSQPDAQINSPNNLQDNTLQDADEEEEPLLNAFTLDGLDSLFEGIPSIDSESENEKKN